VPADVQPARKAVSVEAKWIVTMGVKPYVQLMVTYDDGMEELLTQWTPAETRCHAVRLCRIAEAAEADAFMVDFLTKKIGIELRNTGGVLEDFREYRRQRMAESQ
jgi:hypothetical protein